MMTYLRLGVLSFLMEGLFGFALDLSIMALQYWPNPPVNGFDDLTNCCNN